MTPRPPAPELSRPVAAAQLPQRGRALSIETSETERRALALRFGLPAIAALSADLVLMPQAEGRVRATGRLAARVTQVCVVSLEPFEQEVDAPLAITFVPRDLLEAEDEAGGIDFDAADEEPYDGTTIDIGETVAQSLSLALDPWPRNPDAGLPPAAAEEDGTEALPRSPFAVLAKRRG